MDILNLWISVVNKAFYLAFSPFFAQLKHNIFNEGKTSIHKIILLNSRESRITTAPNPDYLQENLKNKLKNR